MKTIFQTAAAVFGSIPGVAVLLSGIGVPPGYRWLFFGLIEFAGILTLLLLWLNKGRLLRLARKRLTRWCIWLFVASITLLVVSVFLALNCVVTPTRSEYKEFGAVFFPIYTTGEMREKIGATGGRQALLDKYGPTPVVEAITKMPNSTFARTITLAIMLLAYLLTFVGLTLSAALPALVLEQQSPRTSQPETDANG